MYCGKNCACQGCLNSLDYEDTVEGTVEEIKSQNKHAFEPKIEAVTSSSARHKRGCNCQTSMYMKKYCECYQANVGCSNECRCDECENVYGRKEGSRGAMCLNG
ncbi:CRC domain-containing protein TSO1-like [Actinidia eriantha]|uniref:CRC domain-containing protein TSO1-like n=1 Tax=Actinidia eriantha TaxID=165200 RepID=UPI00258674AA|nr:CRC domain-containing protein TSO1-like [Actinidia eriantha]